jgi:hypothetical protein
VRNVYVRAVSLARDGGYAQAIAAAFSTAALAQDKPWCAFFSGGPTNCDFKTLEDCMKAIKGKTGLCDRKSQDVPPAGSDASSTNRRRHHRED